MLETVSRRFCGSQFHGETTRRARKIVRLMARSALLLNLACVASGAAASPQASKAGQATRPPDLSGVWFMQGKVEPRLIDPQGGLLTPWGIEQMEINRKQTFPDALCLPVGVPASWLGPAPFEIIPLKGRILIWHEHQHMIRQIHMDRREHPQDLVPTWMGNSIGRWEGDTLVVDTTGFNTLTRADLWGLPHSDQLHVIERIRRPETKVLEIEITVDDPKAYTKSWKAVRRFDLKPGWEIGEEVCEENNTYLFPHGYDQREK